MFEILFSAPGDIISEAVYDAEVRVLERNRDPWGMEPLPPCPAEASAGPAGPLEVSARIVCEIERAEGMPISRLCEATAHHYVDRLDEMLTERLRREDPTGEEEAARILQELREQYAVI